MNYKIFVRSLMSEEKVFVTELGRGELAIHNEVTDVRFFATKFLWLIPSKDLIKVCVSWHSLKFEDSRKVIISNWKRSPIDSIVNILVWLESQFEWEVTFVFFVGFLTCFVKLSAV